VQGSARNVLSCRWIHPLRTDGERAITAVFVHVSRFFAKANTPGHVVCSGTGKESSSITARGYLHRPVDYGEYQYFEGKVKSHQQAGKSPGLRKTNTGITGGIHEGKMSLYP